MSLNLTIGIPCYGSFKAEMVVSLFNALPRIDGQLHLSVRRGCYLHLLREEIIEEAIQKGSTHLLFIDTDIVFNADHIPKLLALDKDICGANYNTKSVPPISTIKMADPETGKLIRMEPEKIPRDAPFQCAAIATGFMLIKIASLLRSNLELPYFDYDVLDGKFMGEDVNFCLRARKAGLEVWCDPTVRVGHIGEFMY